MLPYLINFSWLKISSFGTFVFLAFAFGLFISWCEARDRGLDDDKFFDAALLAAVMAFVGARLGYVMSRLGDFSDNILKIFVIWQYPGLSMWGGITAGLIAGFMLAKRHKLHLYKFADSLAIGSLYAYLILYMGAFLDGGLVGKLTSLPIGWFSPGVEGKRHLVGLYGAVLGLVFIGALILLKRRSSKPKHGVIFWLILSAIGLAEFLLAFFRDNLLYWDGLSIQLILSTVLFIAPLGPLFILLNGKELIEGWLSKKSK